jgi:hypothetical protein
MADASLTIAYQRLARSYVIQGMQMPTVTWANDARGKSVFWLHVAVRHGTWPSVDDQLGITPGHRQILLATFSRPKTVFPQLMSPFQATRRRNLIWLPIRFPCAYQRAMPRRVLRPDGGIALRA